MSSHDCRLSGALSVAPGVTEQQIGEAVQGFLDRHRVGWRIVDVSAAPTEGFEGVEFDRTARQVNVDANIHAYGGYGNEAIDEMCRQLSSLLDGPNLLVLHDYDTGSSDEAVTPYFLGPTPLDRARAQVGYALDAFEEFAMGLLGKDAVEYLRNLVEKLPLKTEDPQAQVSASQQPPDPQFAHFKVQPVTLLIAVNRSKHDEPAAWDWHQLVGETGDAQLLDEIPGPASVPTPGQFGAIAAWFKDLGDGPVFRDGNQGSTLEGPSGNNRLNGGEKS